MTAQKSPVWSSNGVEWAGSEDASSLECYEHTVGNPALEVVGQNGLSEKISLLLDCWEVGRVALRCHLSMDLPCQEMRDARKETTQSLGSPRSLCSECLEGRRRCSDAKFFSFNVRPGPAEAGYSFEHFLPFFRNSGFPSFRCVPLCFCVYQKVERRPHHLSKALMATVGRMVSS